jgi:uncharacterized membrane protein YkoI
MQTYRERKNMNKKKLVIGAVAAALLSVGGLSAMAVAQSPANQKESSAQEQPHFKGSIAAPQEKDQGNEAAESKQLQRLATIDQATAEQAALKAVPGTVKKTELENEDGFVVYGVEIAGNDGKTYDVKVDAGNAKVLQREVDGADEGGGSEDAG